MILFEFNKPGGLKVISSGEGPFDQCSVCGEASYHKPYGDFPVCFSIPKQIDSWPHFLGDIHYLAVDSLLKTILESNVTGCRFHPLTKILPSEDVGRGGGHPTWLPPPPNYFLLEPTGTIDFEIPSEEATQCMVCERVKKTRFGDYRKPLIPILSEWDGSDVMVSKRIFQHVVIVTPKLINVLRAHGLHRQSWFGLRNQRTEAFSFGGRSVPGVSAQNLDGDSWYEDTVMALKQKFPGDSQ